MPKRIQVVMLHADQIDLIREERQTLAQIS